MIIRRVSCAFEGFDLSRARAREITLRALRQMSAGMGRSWTVDGGIARIEVALPSRVRTADQMAHATATAAVERFAGPPRGKD